MYMLTWSWQISKQLKRREGQPELAPEAIGTDSEESWVRSSLQFSLICAKKKYK